MMKSNVIAALFFVVSSLFPSPGSAAATGEGKTNYYRNLLRAGARHLQTVDNENGMYGLIEVLPCQDPNSTASQIHVVKYPSTTTGTGLTCTMCCSATQGTVYLQGVVTTANAINSASDGNRTELTDGCSSILEIKLTADQDAPLLAAGSCSNGCGIASILCSEDCDITGTTGAIHGMTSSVFSKISSIAMKLGFGLGGGGGRRDRQLTKYIRSPQN